MYNINLYSYREKPITRGRNFTIHPLDESGTKKYFSTESHTTHYLKRTDPFVFKSILGVDYNTLIQQEKEDIPNLKNSKTLNTINSYSNKHEKGMHKSNYISTEKEPKNITENIRYNNKYNTLGNEFLTPKKNKNCVSQERFRTYHRKRNFKEIYGYENAPKSKSRKEKYLDIINSLKYSNLEKDKEYERKYNGYTSYEIPLITFNKYKNNKSSNLSDRLKYTIKYLKKNEEGRNAMNEEELKQNLFKQTSKTFLKSNHLPDILKIANSTQLITRQKIGLSKEMGEKYNPYSFIAPPKNRTGRNYVGDLFKH